ncbi:MAG: nuclear transport factor 2 family protein [Anaerolineales bacterium]|jgi:hypothetical protein|nr:nuclear transport factor 2 family protein [Chloroflexota bacterium]MBK6646595.1 nuclear transport factor 2 family protein [Anaerolineales bacterium]MCC6984816.1 nuclear transport factor 2 family protein [Anaerolineales bacterium]
MSRNIRINFALSLIALAAASLACQSIGGASPSASTGEAPSNPIAEIPTLTIESDPTGEAPAQSGGIYDGNWAGTNTVDDKEILFTVEDNQVVSIALNYTGKSGDCDYHGAISASIDPIEIGSDGFTVVYTGPNDEMTFTGTFASDSEASGTLLIKSPASGLCGEYEKEVTWSAGKGSGAEAQATEDTSGSVSPGDSSAIVNGFFNAVNAGDLDTAIGFVDENVMFSLGSEPVQFGSDNLKKYLSSSGLTFEVSDIESFGGGMAQFKAIASDGATYSFCNMVFQDGKIVSLSLQP